MARNLFVVSHANGIEHVHRFSDTKQWGEPEHTIAVHLHDDETHWYLQMNGAPGFTMRMDAGSLQLSGSADFYRRYGPNGWRWQDTQPFPERTGGSRAVIVG